MARRQQDDGGFSIVEVLVAIALVLTVLGGMLSVMVGSTASVRESRQRQQATAIANRVLERARSLPIGDLAMRSGHPSVPGATADPDGVGPLGAEAVHAGPAGAVVNTPYQEVAGGFTTTTIVTWYDDPLRAGAQNTRRVTTTVSWTAGDRTERIRASTLVANLPRGVP